MPIVNDLNFDFKIKDYDAAKRSFIELCISCGSYMENIGFFGNVGFPGISDIDALVLGTPDVIKDVDRCFSEMHAGDSRFCYLFWHPPVYIIDGTQSAISHLHTLENLQPVEEGSDLSGLLKSEEKCKGTNEALNIAWFIFLIKIVASQRRKLQKGQLVSLRLILLVYKNIFHSFSTFQAPEEVQDKAAVSPQKLRETVRDNKFDPVIASFVEQSFFELAEKAMPAFDAFCFRKADESVLTKQSTLIASRDVIFKKNHNTFFSNRYFYDLISLNPVAFQMVWEYYQGSLKSIMFKDYIISSEEARTEYLSNEIPYAFIQPVARVSSALKRNLLYAVNKVF